MSVPCQQETLRWALRPHCDNEDSRNAWVTDFRVELGQVSALDPKQPVDLS